MLNYKRVLADRMPATFLYAEHKYIKYDKVRLLLVTYF